jgi:hypothetical protein
MLVVVVPVGPTLLAIDVPPLVIVNPVKTPASFSIAINVRDCDTVEPISFVPDWVPDIEIVGIV